MAHFEFPPYGHFAVTYNNSVDPKALAPAAWRPTLPLHERELTWLQWRTDTVATINSCLWPQWDDTNHSWLNGDYAKMRALTLADFELFAEIQTAKLLDSTPTSPVAASSIPSHRQFFLDEDSAKLGDRYFFYDYTLPSAQLDKVATDLRLALKEKAGSTSIQIKQIIQRPRAYQVAKLIGKEHVVELAATSMTSSMSSGHCFQGCIIAAGIYDAWLARGFSPTTSQLIALGKFGVDIGDRRVFAGVHYPSDNISSWIMALRLAPEVFTDRRIAAFVADAIQKHSKVYTLLNGSKSVEFRDGIVAVDTLAANLVL